VAEGGMRNKDEQEFKEKKQECMHLFSCRRESSCRYKKLSYSLRWFLEETFHDNHWFLVLSLELVTMVFLRTSMPKSS
jgi:hypothetical protein